MSESAVLQSAFDYLDGNIQLYDLEAALLDIGPADENSLSSLLIGLLAEASHAHWAADEVREVVASTIYPFVEHETHVGVPSSLRRTQ